MRLKFAATEDIRHAATGEPNLLPEQTRGPSAPTRRRRRHRELNQLLHGFAGHRVVFATRLRPFVKPFNAPSAEPPADPRYRLGGKVEAMSDLRARHSRRAQQDDPSAPNQARRRGWAADDVFEFTTLLTADLEHRDGSHDAPTRGTAR